MKHINHRILIALCSIAIITAILATSYSKRNQDAHLSIAIVQTARHPALDATQQGFIDTINKEYGNKVAWVTYNAHGSIDQAHLAAQSVHANTDIALICAIGTPALQAVAAMHSTVPIVYAAVSNPAAIINNAPTTNPIDGVSDMIDVAKQVQWIKQHYPIGTRIGLLYNRAELNACTIAQQQKELLQAQGYPISESAITHQAELGSALDYLLESSDIILAPTDNVVAQSLALVNSKAQLAGKPIIISWTLPDDEYKHYPAVVAAIGVDYYQHGCQAGRLALKKRGHTIKEVSDAQSASRTIVNPHALSQLKGNQ